MALNFKNPLTSRMTSIINEGCIIWANKQKRDIVLPKDILLSILTDQSEICCKIFEVAGIEIQELKTRVFNSETSYVPDIKYSNPEDKIHPVSNFILQKADNIASDLGHSFIGTEHVILAFLSYKGKDSYLKKIIIIFNEYGLYFETFKDSIINYYMSSSSEISYGENTKTKTKNQSKSSNRKYSSGEKTEDKDSSKENSVESLYLKNINKKVSEGDYKFIGRDLEFERAVRILSRKKKNNIILVGKEGTGKSSFVEGLAKRIVDGKIEGRLKNVTILSLDLSGMIAGTKYRGQFEERMRNVIDFVSKKRDNEKYILFIDEIHQIMGTGAAEGALDASAIIKTELSNGNIQCIGATTTKEYKKYILKDGPFSRRFSSILIEEPNVEETIEILNGVKEEYEKYHNISVDMDVISEIVKLSGRYINDRNFPDKAIDILDEACARKSIESVKKIDTSLLESKIYKIRKKIDYCKTKMEFDKCKELINERDLLFSELNEIKSKYEENIKTDEVFTTYLDMDTVRKVISEFSGIPIIDNVDEATKLVEMERNLNNIIINQERAINKICKAVFRAKSGLKDPDRPIGVYVFLGETGIGKSFVAKELAKYHFGNKDKFIKIDMTEYMEKHSVSKIIGSPPGFVGYDDIGGRLVDKIRMNPYCVILLDEFEKAHPDVFNIFLQAFDEGRLTDSYGDVIDLKNTIIIMTSNVGVNKLSRKSMGFDSIEKTNTKDKEKILIEEFKKIVAPEFFNRIDEVVVFNSLDKDSVMKIFEIEIDKVISRLKDRKISIEYSEKAISFISEKGFSEKYGARPMRRAIQKHISDPLATEIISGQCPPGSTIIFEYIEGDELTLKLK